MTNLVYLEICIFFFFFFFFFSATIKEKNYHLRAIFIGVVRQEVKRSAGSSGFIGNNSLAPQAASCIQFLVDDGGLLPLLYLPLGAACKYQINPFNLVFRKYILPSLNLDISIIVNKVSFKNKKK